MGVFGVVERSDLFFFDQAFRWRGTQKPAPELAIVAIAQKDFEQGAPRWPWPRSLMARLIDEVARQEPAVIVVDILYSERSNTETVITRERFKHLQPFIYQSLSGGLMEIQTREGKTVIGPGEPDFDQLATGAGLAREQDLELAAAVRRAVGSGIHVVLAAQAIKDRGVAGLLEPYQELAAASGGSIGVVGIMPDSDGVLRKYLPYGQDKDGNFVYGLAIEAVAKYSGLDLPETPSPNGDVWVGGKLLVKVDEGQLAVNFPGPPGTHPTLRALDLLRGERNFYRELGGKIVFIGVTDPSIEDALPTPFSTTNRMPAVEFQAAAADTFLQGSFIRNAADYQVVLMVIAFGFGGIALGRGARPLLGLAGTAIILDGTFGAWYNAFVWADWSLPITAPLTALFAGYAISLTDRVSVELIEKQQARSMLSRYLPSERVREMLKNPVAAQLGGKRANITLLISDIRGFTTLSERLDPEEVVALLNEYLTVMTDVIFRHGGTVDKFEGDGILALFGAPQFHQDDPERAVRTALEMRERLGELEARWKEQANTPLEVSIAINSGQAVVGNIGSPRRMEYTVIGDAVNLTSRLQDLTKEYGVSILISGSTYERVRDVVTVRSLGTVQVRGRQQPVSLYEVVGLISDAVEEPIAPQMAIAA